ncbi:HlyD family secretion protein [Paraburkholderia kururiensis]|uniref:HlyD family secretion protein n=1 Tax=Paraburkholderia kururiensis TaxID=984307 RepID=UPI000F87C3F5|nr:HlyD family secretion protein [Paraburkholderia kururiensis]
MSTTSAQTPAVAGALPEARVRTIPWMLLAVAGVVLAVCAALAYWFAVGRWVESTDDAYVGGNVTVIAPKVTGFVDQVLVQDNQYVKANQVLIRLDSRDYDAKLAQAVAEANSAEAAVNELKAKRALQLAVINQQAAGVTAAHAELVRTNADQARYRQLVKDDAVSNQLVEQADASFAKAKAAVEGSDASLLAAKQQLTVLDAQIADAGARVAKAQAEQRYAQLNVDYTTLRSPVDGYVGNRTARVGLLASAGTSMLTVVPAHDLWVDANFKEDQLRRMHDGDPVEVTLDAHAGTIRGTVQSIAPATGATFSILPPENATGNFTKIVQRVPVRVVLDVPKEAHYLRPGLSATVRVHLAGARQRNG